MGGHASDGSDGKQRGRPRKRGEHGGYSGLLEIPAFLQLSGDAVASGRRSRSGSRSRSASPASGVDSVSPVRGSREMSVADVFVLASNLAREKSPSREAQEDLEAYGGRCYWCLCARSTARLTHTHLTPLHASHVQLADIAAFPVAANFNRTTALATVRSGRCPTCPTSGRPSPRPRAARSSQRRAPRVKPLGLLLSRRHMPRRRSASDRRVSMHWKVLPKNGLLYSSPLFWSQ